MQQSVLTVARQDAATLRGDKTIREALNEIRSRGLGEKIVYFYVVDGEDRLVGVIPTRRLLTASLDKPISEVMIDRVVSIPQSASVMEAHELLARYKYLALPVVDTENRIVGVVDVTTFAGDKFDVVERNHVEEIFEIIGFRISQVRDSSPFRAFRFRFPWLLSTIGGGLVCALLASIYATTLAKSLVLAFFLTLVLGLGESVSMQSMAVTIHALRAQPTLRWYLQAFRREVGTALLLGLACGSIVGAAVWLWRGTVLEPIVIGGSIAMILGAACIFGLSVPALLHLLKLDPKIAAGPVTLAITDICTILIYFGLATLLL